MRVPDFWSTISTETLLSYLSNFIQTSKSFTATFPTCMFIDMFSSNPLSSTSDQNHTPKLRTLLTELMSTSPKRTDSILIFLNC